MKILALSALTLFTFVTHAQAARVSWFGHFTIFSQSGVCPDYDPVGSRGIARFRPQLAGTDNGNGSKLVLYQSERVLGYRIESGRFTDTFKTVETINVGENWGPDDTATVQLRFVSQEPPVIEIATKFINVVAEIKNFDFMPGCSVKLRLGLTPRPN